MTRKRSKAVGCGKQQMHKKIRILQKLTYLSAKRGIFCPFFSISLHGPYRKRISHTETTDIFVPATSWKWHSTRPHNYLLCLSSLRRSRDIYLSYYLSILYIYIIHLFIFIFIFRRPPSVVRRPLPPPFPHFRDTRDLKSLRRKRDYASPISCCCDCPSSGSLIFGGQVVHIKEGKGQLALFSTKDNVLLTSHPSYSSAIDLFSLFYFLFFFLISIHYYVDPTLTLPSTFFSTTSLRWSLKVCWLCSFRRIQNGFLIRDLPDFAVDVTWNPKLDLWPW